MRSPPRLLVVAPQPFFSDRGTPIATRHLLEAFQVLGHETDVLTYPIGQSIDITGVRLIRIPNVLRLRAVPIGFSLRKCWLDLFLFERLARCLQESDYACVTALEEAAFVAALVAPRFGVPVIYDMQSSLSEQMTRLWPLRGRLSRSALERLEQWLFNNVDLVMTSAGLATHVERVSPQARVQEWRYPAVAGTAAPSRVEELRSELGLEGTARVVLYSGSFMGYQGLSNLLHAVPSILDRIPDAVLVLVGAEAGVDDHELRRQARALPAHSVRILDRQPQESMAAYLELAHVVVSPRLYGNNLPLKILEYMAAGRAIVATSIAAHRTILDEDRALLVDVGPQALAAGIITLLLDDVRRAELARNARTFAERELGALEFIQSVREILQEVGVNG